MLKILLENIQLLESITILSGAVAILIDLICITRNFKEKNSHILKMKSELEKRDILIEANKEKKPSEKGFKIKVITHILNINRNRESFIKKK